MTPVAMAVAREALLSGDKEYFDALCQCQWFECSEIADAAFDMAASCGISSSIINWPADACWIEFKWQSVRLWREYAPDIRGRIAFFLCKNFTPEDNILPIHPDDDPELVPHFACAWKMSSIDNVAVMSASGLFGSNGRRIFAENAAIQLGVALRCMEIITTPRLVLTEERRSKPQRVKGVSRMIPGATWKKVTIDPQATITPKLADAQGPSMPLHFVHGHMKPSLGRFIDGYWRGNAALGIRLHTYDVKGPRP